jgi:ABC-type Fe3+/spermidine/putrescine transport system ATPase subunit
VDEVADGLGVMRVSERERLVVPVGAGTQTGDELRVAVRPERVRIEPTNGRAPEGGSTIEGTVAELVYLGGLTQFHVETKGVGRVVSHRMDDEVAAALEPGKHVTLTWPAEHAYVLAGAVSSEA